MDLLIVDDNPNQLYSLKIALRAKGHSVMTAESAKEALGLLRQCATRFDAVLTDYAMPGMTGFDLMSHIHKEYGFLSVVIMTAYGKKDLVINALRKGCDGFLEKPFTVEQLEVELKRVKMVSHRNSPVEALGQQLQRLLLAANDKLTVITINTEIALLDLEHADLASTKKQLGIVTSFTNEIGDINKKMIQIVNEFAHRARKEAVEG